MSILTDKFGTEAPGLIETLFSEFDLAEVDEENFRISREDAQVFLRFDSQEQLTFYSYTAGRYRRGFITDLTEPVSRLGLELEVVGLKAIAGTIESMQAFPRIGFKVAGPKGRLDAPPARVREYADWKRGDAEEPRWRQGIILPPEARA